MSLRNTLLIIITLSYSICHAATNTPQITQPTTNPASVNNKSVTTTSPLEFLNPWARPSMSTSTVAGSNNSVIYFVIHNNSNSDYKLVNVSSDIANKVELHKSFVDDKGVSRMVKIDNLVIPAGTSAELKPGSTHIMLFNLKRPLKIGDKFPLSLYFSDNTQQNIMIEVKDNGGK